MPRPAAAAVAIILFTQGALAPLALEAQSPFEGVVSARVSSDANAADIAFMVKGDLLRVDMTGMQGMTVFAIHDAKKGSTTVVIPMMQMYMDQPTMTMPPKATGDSKPSIKWTGRKETIAGYECEHATLSDDRGGQVDACLARGLGNFMMPDSPMGRGARGGTGGWASSLGTDVFPLKVQQVGGSGSVAFEVTKIEKKTLEPSIFSIPDGYTKMDMGMMRGRPPRV